MARAFAAELPSFIAVQSGVRHTNQFLAYAAGDADAVNKRLLALIEERHIGLPAWRAAHEPGRITTEFAVSRAALKLAPAAMAALVAAAIAPSADSAAAQTPADDQPTGLYDSMTDYERLAGTI